LEQIDELGGDDPPWPLASGSQAKGSGQNGKLKDEKKKERRIVAPLQKLTL
jgi:hypothetical protein